MIFNINKKTYKNYITSYKFGKKIEKIFKMYINNNFY